MSDDAGAAGGGENPGGSKDDKETKDDKVAYDTYKKVLDEKKAMQKRLEDLDAKSKSDKDAELKQKEQYKELLLEREKELEDTKTKLAAKDQETQNYQRMASFLKNVQGEVPQQYWGLIELDKIIIDDSGKIDEGSVKKAVKDFEKNFPEVIKKAGAKMPNDAPSGGGGILTLAEWQKLPYDEKRKRQKDVEKTV